LTLEAQATITLKSHHEGTKVTKVHEESAEGQNEEIVATIASVAIVAEDATESETKHHLSICSSSCHFVTFVPSW
jgi:hypothetical protein